MSITEKGDMKKKSDIPNDDELNASYEAYKALIETGSTKAQALSRTGLTAQMVKDLEVDDADEAELEDDEDEDEDDDLGYEEEATEEWDAVEEGDNFEDDSKWEEEDLDAFDDDDIVDTDDSGYDDGF